MERSKPFGEITGIDYWDACKRAGTNLDSLRSFLGTIEALPEDLRGFIANSSDEVLRDQLLRPIEWDTENKARPFVEDSVKRRLISYGDRIYNLPPYESEKALSYLLKYIWDVVCQTEARRLDYTDFIQAFQDALTVRITVHELEQLRRSAQAALQLKQMVTPLLAAAGEVTSGQFPDAVLEPFLSPSLARFAQRHDLVTTLGTKLSADGILVLKGSTGMGKSTLAYLIAGSDEGRWRRLDM